MKFFNDKLNFGNFLFLLLLVLVISCNKNNNSKENKALDGEEKEKSNIVSEKVIIYADENYPPYSYVEKNELNGIYVEIIKEINEKLPDFEIELKPIPWTRGLKMLEDGKAYGLIPPYYKPEERPYIIYSTPILLEKIVIVGFDKEQKKWPDDFVDSTIGINRGFVIFTPEEKEKLIIEEANSTGENLLKLIHERIDYYANDKHSITLELKKMQNKKVINQQIVDKIKEVSSLREEWGYIGYSRTFDFSRRNEFERLVNQEIEKMKIDGTIDKIINKFIN